MQDFSKATFLQVTYQYNNSLHLCTPNLAVNKNMRTHLFLHTIFRTWLDLEGLSLAVSKTILEFCINTHVW